LEPKNFIVFSGQRKVVVLIFCGFPLTIKNKSALFSTVFPYFWQKPSKIRKPSNKSYFPYLFFDSDMPPRIKQILVVLVPVTLPTSSIYKCPALPVFPKPLSSLLLLAVLVACALCELLLVAMGIGGTLEYLSGLLGGSGGHGHYKKRKQLQTVELKVRMDCEGCELKVKSALSSLKGPFFFFTLRPALC
jgi:hypothetical protein